MPLVSGLLCYAAPRGTQQVGTWRRAERTGTPFVATRARGPLEAAVARFTAFVGAPPTSRARSSPPG